jgi:predicted TIM-barrel fold metal-dependent hydrolase
MTPLFDSNAHPRLATQGSPDDFAALRRKLETAEFCGACAVALPGKDGFAPEPYFTACHASKFFFPVAAWQETPEQSIDGEIARLAAIGYRAIKIHPRLSGLSVRDKRFRMTLQAAAQSGLAVFHCSYQFSTDTALHPIDPLPALLDAIAGAPGLRMVLLHGGTVELLRYAESIRGNHNLLLDLSFTLNRYEGSSIDQDIAYLFHTFDQRVCIGTDYPDYEPAQVRARFEALAAGLPRDKVDNIGRKNITGLLGIGAPD